MPTNRRPLRRTYRPAGTPPWALRLLLGEPMQPGDADAIFDWQFFDHRVEGLPDPESDEGRALLRGRRPGVEGT